MADRFYIQVQLKEEKHETHQLNKNFQEFHAQLHKRGSFLDFL